MKDSQENPFDPTLSPVSEFLHERYTKVIRTYRDSGMTPREVAQKELERGSSFTTKDDPTIALAAATGLVHDLLSAGDENVFKDCIDEIVKAARDGDEDWLDRCAFIMTNLSKRGIPLPQSLAELARDVTLGAVIRKSRGRPKPWKRDIMIQETIAIMLHCFSDLRATRNAASAQESACSIVAEVLEDFDIKLSEKSVEAIYLRRA